MTGEEIRKEGLIVRASTSMDGPLDLGEGEKEGFASFEGNSGSNAERSYIRKDTT